MVIVPVNLVSLVDDVINVCPDTMLSASMAAHHVTALNPDPPLYSVISKLVSVRVARVSWANGVINAKRITFTIRMSISANDATNATI